jgi:hypothetical protein
MRNITECVQCGEKLNKNYTSGLIECCNGHSSSEEELYRAWASEQHCCGNCSWWKQIIKENGRCTVRFTVPSWVKIYTEPLTCKNDGGACDLFKNGRISQ